MLWLFADEIQSVKDNIEKGLRNATETSRKNREDIDNILRGLDLSVDVHENGNSWAVISLRAGDSVYLKFIDLSRSDIRDIADFLRKYERASGMKIDALPRASDFFRIR